MTLGSSVARLVLLLLAAATSCSSLKCNRMIDGTTMPRSPAEEKYHLYVTLYNRSDAVYAYMPSTRYTVTIVAESTGPLVRKFTRFLISAEPENANDTSDSGVFDLMNEALTKFSDNCPNAVIETTQVPKEEVSIAWTSPGEGSGCVLIRATVLETADTWYMDDPNLMLNMCPDSKAEADDQGPVLPACCACEEAKYEVTFEGLWSRNTHPKDYPTKGWLIRFSDVIGASHTVDYRFWQYNGNASEGLREVAELGSTRKLESELKDQSEHIRTIIKARGITYPNVTGKTFAVFRVDRKHHLMSLVSMIDPSPDWIVGVSGLELCMEDCTWIERKELNLYPYDAGTDDGITYLSPDSKTIPQEPIRRITSTYPNDSRSPFYDPSGLDMKPLARLYLNRQRLYEKTCGNAPETVDPGSPPPPKRSKNNKNSKNKACRVTSWGEWSRCTVSCGKGNKLRQRGYRDATAAAANKCNATLTDRGTCYGEKPQCPNGGRHPGLLDSEMCALEPWGAWSSCTTTCGPGSKTRSRNFAQKNNRKHCRAEPGGPQLQQTIDCENDPCFDEDTDEVRERSQRRHHHRHGKHHIHSEEKQEKGVEENGVEEEGEKGAEGEEDDEEEEEEEEEEVGNDGFSSDQDYEAEEAEVDVTEEWLQPSANRRSYSCNYPTIPAPFLAEPSMELKSSHKCPPDRYTPWSMWSPCTSTCGPGVKIRSRLVNKDWSSMGDDEEDANLADCKVQQAGCIAEIPTCNISKEEAEKICSEPMVKGNCNGNTLRAYFDKHAGRCHLFKYSGCDGNRNNFQTVEDCNRVCGNYQNSLRDGKSDFKGIQTGSQVMESNELMETSVDCETSEWSKWTRCQSCRGFTISTRQILVPSRGRGKSCSWKMLRKRKCHKVPPCSLQGDGISRRSSRDKNSEPDGTENEFTKRMVNVDCRVTSWSTWSRCTATCGDALQHRTRTVKIQPRGLRGKLCPALVEFRKCPDTIECP